MVESRKLDKINKCIFLVAIFCIIFRKYIQIFVDQDVALGKTTSLLLYGSMALLLLQFIINKNRSKKGLFFLIGGIALYLITRDGSILAIVLVALGMEVMTDEFSAKSYLGMHSFLFIVGMIFVAFLPDLAHREEIHYRIVDGLNYARYSFGAGNPNAVFFVLLPVYATYIFLRFKKYNILDRLVIAASLYVIYTNTGSRTGLLSIVAGLIVVEILKVVNLKESKIVKYGVTFTPIIITLISVVSSVFLYNNEILIKLLSSRTKYWHTYVQKQGKLFTLFGNDYSDAMKVQNPLDNSYIYIIAILGMVTMTILLVILCKGLYEYCKRDEKEKIVAVLIFLIFAFGENMMLEAGINFGLALIIKDMITFNSEPINIYKYPMELLKQIRNRRTV